MKRITFTDMLALGGEASGPFCSDVDGLGECLYNFSRHTIRAVAGRMATAHQRNLWYTGAEEVYV